MTTATLTFNNATPATITRASGSFITDGWVARQKIIITGTVNNNKTVEIRSVAALTITLAVTSTLTQENNVTNATLTIDNKKLTRIPATGSEVTETLTGITSADPNGIPFDNYVTVVGYPGQASIPAGTWMFFGTFSATNTSCTAKFEVFTRSSDGLTTTTLFTTVATP